MNDMTPNGLYYWMKLHDVNAEEAHAALSQILPTIDEADQKALRNLIHVLAAAAAQRNIEWEADIEKRLQDAELGSEEYDDIAFEEATWMANQINPA